MNEWVEGWHRYYRMKRMSEFEERANINSRKQEIDIFLSVLRTINKKEVSLLELGAGWGEWCLALAGVVNFGITKTPIRKFI